MMTVTIEADIQEVIDLVVTDIRHQVEIDGDMDDPFMMDLVKHALKLKTYNKFPFF